VVGIPFFPHFLVSLLVGTQIAIFLSIRTGSLLFLLMQASNGGTVDDALIQTQAIQSFGILMATQFVALLPVYFSRKTKTE
jgi:hypothetical protein